MISLKNKVPFQLSNSLAQLATRSDLLGESGMMFLSANNTVVVAHIGSTASLNCRLTKTPSFGMVSQNSILLNSAPTPEKFLHFYLKTYVAPNYIS